MSRLCCGTRDSLIMVAKYCRQLAWGCVCVIFTLLWGCKVWYKPHDKPGEFRSYTKPEYLH
jgi:hypothetical protein